MQWFSNLKIGTKLILGFVMVALIAGVIGVIGIKKIHQVDAADEKLYEKITVPLGELAEVSISFQRIRVNARDIITAHSPEEIRQYTGRIKELNASISENATKFEKTILTDEGRKLFEEFMKTRLVYGPLLDKVVELAMQHKDAEALELLHGAAGKASRDEQNAIEKLMESKLKQAKLISDENTEITDAASRLMTVLAIAGALLAICLGLFISRAIIRPINEAVCIADSLAQGDLTITVESKSTDETGQMMQSIKNMVEKLREVVADVKSAADNVAAGSQQLSSGSEEMSQGASEQAASAEEASSSMEEMTANIRQNADNAVQTEKIAQKSAVDAKQGGEAVNKTVHAMKDIAGKITIIEEIARQTNLLALNAAIEAARAGEHGKGFAVVASEVRKLAERSQKAAAEISELSSSSVDVAERAGDLLSKMVPDIQKTAELVQEISAACREQDTGAEQINKAIQQLDQVIQQNAGASEEMSSTSEELASQAEQLQATIAFFRVDGHAAAKNGLAAPKPANKTAFAGRANPGIRNVTYSQANGYGKQKQMAMAAAVRADIDLGGGALADDAAFEKF